MRESDKETIIVSEKKILGLVGVVTITSLNKV
jgi:hypothetical protein